MGKVGKRTASNPVVMAEDILFRLDSSPWPLVVFLSKTRSESIHAHCYRPNDPEVERIRKRADMRELGTYTRGVLERDLVQDILDEMRRIR